MSSVEYLREFVNERLTAAAEEIFRVFKNTIIEYEEEIDRQRKLLDVVWKPEIKLHRIELPLQYIFQDEEVLADQQLCIQERNSSLDQEDPEPPQIKEEQEELCTSQEGEQLEVKQETETFMLTPTDEESDHSEDQTLDLNHYLTQNTTDKESIVNISVKDPVVPEPNSDHQLLSHTSHVAESQDQKGGKHGESGSTRNTEPEPKESQDKSHSNNVFTTHLNTWTDKTFPLYICDFCGKDFDIKSKLDRHLRAHKDEKPYFCNTCGNSFKDMQTLTRHKTIHTGERPYSCQICGKKFRLKSDVKVHIRTHTGEKRFKCNTCGKRYCRMTDLRRHSRIHTIQYICQDEEVLADQQLFIQERNSSLDQEDPEPPQIKEEPEQLCTSQEGEQLEVKQETETFMLTPTDEESNHSEDQTLDLNHDLTQNAAEKESIVNLSVKSSEVSEPNCNHQLLSHNSHVAESQDQKGGTHGDPNKSHSNNVCKTHLNTCTGQMFPLHICAICGKDFDTKSKLVRHFRVHTDEKPYFCNTCRTGFNDISTLRRHKTIHTGERPYSCKTCGKKFRLNSDLKVHSRTHTGEKRFNCNTCGTRYRRMIELKRHTRTHTSD
ncbi:uncharacterized protein LOC141769757 isoform X1 [Sebastes fasciatus]|uniref:uncharacterized protein LOC141769757 isoform X1 n=1 Tax=Sebastes fasciatus TaxID=394691 RepID=UPI003D9F465D